MTSSQNESSFHNVALKCGISAGKCGLHRMNIAQNGIKRSHRQTHDAVIVALDALDEQCAVALNAVGAGLVERLSGGEVGGKHGLYKRGVE